MTTRSFGKLGWPVGQLGCGMWGMASWSGADEAEAAAALDRAADLGCNFFDTAYAYSEGRSEGMLAALARRRPRTAIVAATKVPPKNRVWPSRRGFALADVFPPDYIRQMAEKSRENLGGRTIDLLQFHVWEDAWADDDTWRRTMEDLKRQSVIRAVGISVNRWEPWNGMKTIRAGGIDAVQVIYNIFDQAPEDELFPLCQELGVAVIARVPFDEGSLTGTLTPESKWPEGDWRNTYFVPGNLRASVERAERLRRILPPAMTMPELALRFILSHPAVSTVIPGMRKRRHVEENAAAAARGPLDPSLLAELKNHRWDRAPTEWSQ